MQPPLSNQKEKLMSNTYYCPRGCNVCDERAIHVTGLECGSCGSIMTTDSTDYDAVHFRIELEGIAACEPGVIRSANGFFIGMRHKDGPDRLSLEYWRTFRAANNALKSGKWTEKHHQSSDWKWGD